MSSDSKYATRDILYDEAIRFLKTVTGDSKCYACGCDVWEVASDGNDDQKALLVPTNTSFNGKLSRSLLLVCKVCGLERQHRDHKIVEWLKANPEESVDGTDD